MDRVERPHGRHTERPITVTQGTNQLVIIDELEKKVSAILVSSSKEVAIPEFWDGKAAIRFVDSIKKKLIVDDQ